MKKAYLGIDIGSISTKGVVIDSDHKIISSCYLWMLIIKLLELEQLVVLEN